MAEPKADAPTTARVGPGGVVITDTRIEPPPKLSVPLAADMPPLHRELNDVQPVDDEYHPGLVYQRPFGSEPRNVDIGTGRTIPLSAEQRDEIEKRATDRIAASAEDLATREAESQANAQGSQVDIEARRQARDEAADRGRKKGLDAAQKKRGERTAKTKAKS